MDMRDCFLMEQPPCDAFRLEEYAGSFDFGKEYLVTYTGDSPVRSVNGKMGDVVIDIKDDPQFAALVGFTSTGSAGVTEKDALGTKIMNKISAAKTASQLGFFYDATEDVIHLYLLFALQTSSNKRKFYRIVKYSDQQEPLTLEGGDGITVREITIPADDQTIYTVRFNIQNPSSRADRKYTSVRLAVVVYDDNDNEIERYYGAQYFYAYDDVTGTVSRTIYSNVERGPSDFIIDIGLKNNTNAAMGKYTAYIASDTLSDGLSPIVATNQPTGFDLVVPDSFFDNAPFGYSIAAILGDFTRIYGPTVYKAEELTKNSVGLGNVANERQYSAENPPPYPVTSVNGQTGDVSVESGGSPTLLWTNPHPTSVFAEQTLSLDLSEYSFVIIEYGHDYGFVTGTAIFPVPTITPTQGYSAYNEIQGVKWTGSQCALYLRRLKITTSSIWFGDGTRFTTYNTSQATTTDNNVGFPKRIWGVK